MPKMLQVQIPHKAFRRQSSVVLFWHAFQNGTDQGPLAGTKDGGTKNCIQCPVEDARLVTENMEREDGEERKSEVLEGPGFCRCRWCRRRCQSRSRDSPLRNLKMQS